MASLSTHAAAQNRIAGIDIARAIALIGMLMVHFGPERTEGLAGTFYSFPHGRASLLFAVVAGVGMALLARRREGRGLARLRMAWFAIVLLPFGLWLQTLNHPVAVILHHYAFFFLFGLAICGLSRKALLTVAIVTTFIGPALYLAGRMEAFPLFARRSVEFGDTGLSIVQALFTAGPYPLLTWAGPIAFGLFLGRCDLRDTGTRWAMVAFGIGISFLTAPLSGLGYELFGAPASRSAWQMIFSASPHSQMPLWLINSTAIATAIIGGALIVGDRLGRFAGPLVTLGQFVLSAYVVHLFVLAGWRDLVQRDTSGEAMLAVLLYCAIVTVLAMAWQRLVGRRGPVEWVMHAPWDAVRQRRTPAEPPVLPDLPAQQ